MRKTIPKSYEYIEKLAPNETAQMQLARESAQELGLEQISLSSTEAQLIKFHLQNIQAQRVVEVGTLTGLSALYILQALPQNGFLWTLEKSDEHVQKAQIVLQHEITNKRCQIVMGDARESLKNLASEAPFDAVFIDGNKAAYLDYFDWACENIRLGGLVLVDNVFLSGAVWGDFSQQKFSEKQVRIVQQMNQKAFALSNFNSVFLPTEEGLLLCQKQF